MNTPTRVERTTALTPAEVHSVAPEVDIRETKDEYLLEADMPGVAKEGLEVLLEGNELTLIGRRQPPPAGDVLYREIRGHDYRRVFQLDPVIDASRIRAQIEQGLLTVHLPKAEKVRPRKIAVSD
jgi:HSP20 family protein